MIEAGKRVMFIDADMRKSVLNGRYQMSKATGGLAYFLAGRKPLEECIFKTNIPRLFLIPTGAVPPNPAELIASDKCKELFDLLRERYDYIIIDTPPVGLVTDAFLLMKYSDVNLFIVRQGVTNKNIFGSIIKDLENRDLNISIVINGIQTNKGGYGYGKKYGYGYGYAYGYGYGRYGSNSSGYYGNDYYGEAENEGKKSKHKSKDKE